MSLRPATLGRPLEACAWGFRSAHRSVLEGGTPLNREVTLKILSDAFAADPDRLPRFQRAAPRAA